MYVYFYDSRFYEGCDINLFKHRHRFNKFNKQIGAGITTGPLAPDIKGTL